MRSSLPTTGGLTSRDAAASCRVSSPSRLQVAGAWRPTADLFTSPLRTSRMRFGSPEWLVLEDVWMDDYLVRTTVKSLV